MLRKGIGDIRLLRADDSRVADQMRTLEPYREVCDEFVVFDWSDRPLQSTVDDLTTAVEWSTG